MKITSPAQLRQALDDAINRSLDQTREAFEAAGVEAQDLEVIVDGERRRLEMWRADVEAMVRHEAAAPPLPDGVTITIMPRPTGHLH